MTVAVKGPKVHKSDQGSSQPILPGSFPFCFPTFKFQFIIFQDKRHYPLEDGPSGGPPGGQPGGQLGGLPGGPPGDSSCCLRSVATKQ